MRYIIILLIMLPSIAFSESYLSLQDKLFARALKGTKCEQIPNNGRYCSYQFDEILKIGIKDVGGTDTVVVFHKSNIDNELYAVLYFGCIVIVPGHTHQRNYTIDYGVYISPTTGLVYNTLNECKKTL